MQRTPDFSPFSFSRTSPLSFLPATVSPPTATMGSNVSSTRQSDKSSSDSIQITSLGQGRVAITYPMNDPRGRLYYEGDFIDGKREGRGLFRWRDGVVYEGDWSNDDMHGKWGRMIWPEGLVYEGEWAHGQMHGEGCMKRFNASSSSRNHRKKKSASNPASSYAYHGHWKQGHRDGHGIQIFAEDDSEGRVRYEGEWCEGLRHGYGKMLWKDGSSYMGEWSKGVRNGFGIFVDMLRDGERYEGRWLNDMQEDDQALVVDKHGNEYRGAFVKGFKHGDGVFTSRHHARVRYEIWVRGHRTCATNIPPIHTFRPDTMLMEHRAAGSAVAGGPVEQF